MPVYSTYKYIGHVCWLAVCLAQNHGRSEVCSQPLGTTHEESRSCSHHDVTANIYISSLASIAPTLKQICSATKQVCVHAAAQTSAFFG